MIWVIVFSATLLLHFIPNRLINTNCSHIYRGLIIIAFAALVGMSDHSVIAMTILILGALIGLYGKHYKHM